MSDTRTDALIDLLASEPAPVAPLAPASRRAFTSLALVSLFGAAAIAMLPGWSAIAARARAGGGPWMFGIEQAAMLATAAIAVIGAFQLSIPGRSRRWFIAPLFPFALWLLVGGWNSYAELLRDPAGATVFHTTACFWFISGVGIAIGAPLLWRLSRAAPIDPVPVALLGGLGAAALAAFLLQFFHPFAVTVVDFAVHLVAIATIVALAVLLNRPALRPA